MRKGLWIITLLALIVSCKREYDEKKFGPEVIIVPEDFEVSGFTISPSNSVNLATTDAYFNCSMDRRAEFKIIIKGLLSGAEKIVSGVGNNIDISNSTWTGDSDNLIMFRSGENCSVELSFRGALKKYYDTLAVTAENVYPKTVLINNFEGLTFDKNGPNTGAYGNYLDAADFAQSDIKTDAVLATPQGIQSVKFDGVDVNNGYYIGGMYFYPASPTYIFSGYEPDSLYLNFYLYSYGDNSTNLNFSFSEDDNGDNTHNALDDDQWTIEVPVTQGQGWSLMSFRLKDFKDGNLAAGNGALNLDKIKGFNVNMNARVPGTRARVNLDYIVVSYGRPFEP